jgi:predicted CoA-substrate-specific enzyme activase
MAYSKKKKGEKTSYGICLGASTISAVELSVNQNSVNNFEPDITVKRIFRIPHEGNPKKAFKTVLNELKTDGAPILVTGRKFCHFLNLKSITEPEAVEYALHFILKENQNGKYRAVVSAGGETFMVYTLNEEHRISGILTGNKCASGTGEFYLQQIKRMKLKLEESIKLAHLGEVYPVSGRCSVFCKSDCTHALNKGQPVENIAAGLCKMIANKITELLAKANSDNVLLVGGTALNSVVVKKLREELNNVTVPREASYFEALGAAIAALRHGSHIPKDVFKTAHSHFNFLPPLKESVNLVTFKTFKTREAGELVKGDECIMGLDVGSTTTKAVLMRFKDNAVLRKVYLRTNGNPVEATKKCYLYILKQIAGLDLNISAIGVTGSGRKIAGLYSLTDGIINEIIAHAAAAVYFEPAVDTIFEIGGQDAKYTYITNGVASDYAMNEACSAGTGSFLEESAFESLNVKVTDIAEGALRSTRPPNFSDQCAAFISSDIKNAIHEAIPQDDILAGLVYSVCFNYVNRVKGNRQIGRKIFMQGGVCYNRAVPVAMASILKKPIVVPPEPGLMGAFGVALEVKKRLKIGILKKQKFQLAEIINRRIEYSKPFICRGGKENCDLKCLINRIKLNNKTYLFGGACNRYYNILHHTKVNEKDLDYVDKRNRLMFERYSAGHYQNRIKTTSVGLCTSLITNRLFPLYYNFFAFLGCRMIIPQGFNEKALNRQTTSMCYPAEIALGLFDNLLDQDPDYIFMPHVRELYVPGGIKRKDFCATCLLVQGESFWLQQAFKDKSCASKMISPTVNFNGGWEFGRNAFVKTARELGFSKNKADKAYDAAIKSQEEFEQECFKIGQKLLLELKHNQDEIVIVLFGRPYNAYNGLANKGIPKKFASRGVKIIPFEMLPYDKEPLSEEYDDYMHWEAGQRILRAAEIVKKHNQLFGVYLTNFLCAPDSFLVSYFRKIMGTRPSLILEVDGHTADAGINTRIEAFLDVINNYRKIDKQIKTESKISKLARIDIQRKKPSYIDSDGNRFRFDAPEVKLIIPSMGDLGSKVFACVFKRFGINTVALPVPDKEVLRLGRSVTTGKECLPMIMCIGSLLKYLKYRQDKNEKLMMVLPKAGGYCRLGQYNTYTKQVLRDRGIRDVALLAPAMEENYHLFDPGISLWAWKSCVVSDVMDDIRNVIEAAALDIIKARKIFYSEYEKICDSFLKKNPDAFYKQLVLSARQLGQIKLKVPLEKCPLVNIAGEIFVRLEQFSNLNLARRLTDRGFVVKIAPKIEWFYYIHYLIKQDLFEPNHSLRERIEYYITNKIMRRIEKKIKRILAETGLYRYELINIPDIVRYAFHLTPLSLDGEHHLIGGTIFRDSFTRYCGIINIGPFGCMQVRLAEGIFSRELTVQSRREVYKLLGKKFNPGGFKNTDQIPFLTIESDGNPFPQLLEARFENFCLQAARIAKRQGRDTSLLNIQV